MYKGRAVEDGCAAKKWLLVEIDIEVRNSEKTVSENSGQSNWTNRRLNQVSFNNPWMTASHAGNMCLPVLREERAPASNDVGEA